MNTPSRLLIVTALAMLTASVARAELGETPAQFESGKPYNIEVYTDEDFGTGPLIIWRGKTLTHVGHFVNNVCVSEVFYFNDHRRMTQKDCDRFLAPYYAKWSFDLKVRDSQNHDHGTFTDRRTGQEIAYMLYDHKQNNLFIEFSRPSQSKRRMRTAEEFLDAPDNSLTVPVQEDKNDCMVVATENLHRLAAAAPWSNILMYSITVNGQLQPLGHAVAVWKITLDGNVFVVDSSGTFEVFTTSTDANDILAEMAKRFSRRYGGTFVLKGYFADRKTEPTSTPAATEQTIAGKPSLSKVDSINILIALLVTALLLAWAVAWGLIAYSIQQSQKQSGGIRFLVGFILGPLGCLILWLSKPKRTVQREPLSSQARQFIHYFVAWIALAIGWWGLFSGIRIGVVAIGLVIWAIALSTCPEKCVNMSTAERSRS
jgi:hypothetical protein